MEILSEEIAPRPLRQGIKVLEELAAHPAWTEYLLPEINDLIFAHNEAAIDMSLTQEERTSHIQAIHTLRSLAKFPQTKAAQLESQWKTEAKKRQTQA
jgi:hypothetical protein